MRQLDIIVPARNEAENLPDLLARIHGSLSAARISYRVIIVDDQSTDSTWRVVKSLSSKYPIKIIKKVGPKGKASAILQGASHATAKVLAMLDADLEYPPEALPEMFNLLLKHGHGVVVANRVKAHKNLLRRLLSKLNRAIFAKAMLGFSCDVQSGLKVFKKEIISHLNPAEIGAWAIDMPLLHTCVQLGFSVGSVDIDFFPRAAGNSKCGSEIFSAAWQIGLGALRLKLSPPKVYHLAPRSRTTSLGAGLAHKGRRFITHTRLPLSMSAFTAMDHWQRYLLLGLLLLFVYGMLTRPLSTGIAISAVLSAVYFLDMIFSSFMAWRGLNHSPELTFDSDRLASLSPKELPVYTILCPLYREAKVLPDFLYHISLIDWPKNKLDVILLLEEDDAETIATISKQTLPEYVRAVVVPHSLPKTKPKACNYGLNLARGKYIVVYDAEDRPDPLQLKKAYLGFKSLPKSVVCLQAKLNYFNPRQNLLTRLFTAEYSLWFDVILPGYQSFNTVIPLGGTSNHFRTQSLVSLHGWDAFNVTEDCDLGARLFKRGYKTAIIDSTTYEEANSRLGNWLRQRSRWIKGYIQTWLVHNRAPFSFIKTHGWHAFFFQLVVGGKTFFTFINPILWLATISYFVAYSLVGPVIETLYPTPVFYIAGLSAVFGNFLFLYYYMIGLAKRGQWDLIKYVFLVPLYWLAVSLASFKAVFQLLIKPHYWEKTHHGFHLKPDFVMQKDKMPSWPSFSLPSLPPRPAWIKPHLFSGSLLILSALVANIFNFVYNAYLGRHLTVEEFGLISLMGSFFYLTTIPTNSLYRTVTHRVAFLAGKFQSPPEAFRTWLLRKNLWLSVIAALLWTALTPLLSQLFQTDNYLAFIAFAPVWVMTLVGAINAGYLNGLHRFSVIALLVIVDSLVKVGLAIFFVSQGLTSLVYAAVPFSLLPSFVVGWFLARRLKGSPKTNDLSTSRHFPRRFFLTSVLFSLSTLAFLSADVILAKIFLSPAMAGQYALLSFVGKIVYFIGTLFSQFIVPVVSLAEGKNQKSQTQFNLLLVATIFASLVGFVFVGLLGHRTVPVLFGEHAATLVPYLRWFTAAMGIYGAATAVVNYHHAKKHYLFPLLGFIFSGLHMSLIMFRHDSISHFVDAAVLTSLSYLFVVVFIHSFSMTHKTVLFNLFDLFRLLLPLTPRPKTPGQSLRILILNWYDVTHKWAGGAEIYIHEVAKRWVADGHSVTMFTGNDQTQASFSIVDGVKIVRRGGQFTVAIWAFIYYVLKFRGSFDVIVDIPKGVPFFTPLYTALPKICLVHQVHQDMFRTELGFPVRQLALFLESTLMPIVYKQVPFVAVSQSTRDAISKIGLGQTGIDIVHPGVDIKKAAVSKTSYPSLIYLGRLRPYKQVDLLIKAVADVSKRVPGLSLTIAGTGEDEVRLKDLVRKLCLESQVRFTGKVTEQEKAVLLTQSWIAVQPSMVEGWGITNIEANICGTPVIASRVDGLKDSVIDGTTGLLVTPKDVSSLSRAIETLVKSPSMRARLGQNAIVWGSKFSWDECSRRLMAVVRSSMRVQTKPAFTWRPIWAKRTNL